MVFRLFDSDGKIYSALSKTRNAWEGGIASLLRRAAASDESVWEEIEEALISADVGVETTIKLTQEVRGRVRDEKISAHPQIVELFKEELAFLLESNNKKAEEPGDISDINGLPYVILVVGVNGAGKTTSVAKLAAYYKSLDKKVVLAAADTFRAGAIEQIKIWASQLGIDVVAHQSGADPGAVAYDAYQAALARSADVLILDTAGRLHTKSNLMEELKKIRHVLQRQNDEIPQQTLLVLDATTGHNGLSQALAFKSDVEVDGIFLTKLDGTAKGGIVVAIAQELKLPVLFLGTGENLSDISSFDTDSFVDSLFGDDVA